MLTKSNSQDKETTMEGLKFCYITTIEAYIEAIKILSKRPELALDTETYALKEYGSKGSALDPHTGRISILTLKGRKGKTYLFDIIWLQHLKADFSLLIELLQSREYLLFHNAKFDLKMILSTFGILLSNVKDTMLMSQLISNATGSKFGKSRGNSYKDLCRDLFNVHVGGKGKEQVTEWGIGIQSRNLDNDWWLDKLQYAAVDVKYLFHIYDKLLPWLINPLPDSPLTETGVSVADWGFGMAEVLDREFRYLPLLAEREYVGMPISAVMSQYLQQAIKENIEDLAAELSIFFELDEPTEDPFGNLRATPAALRHLRSSQKMLSSIQKALKMNKLDTVQGKILNRIIEIMDTLSSIEGDDLSAAFIDEDEEALYEELKQLEEGALKTLTPIIQKIVEFKGLVKQDGMNINRFINPATGRIHSNFNQLGTATGRLSSSNCNLQQISHRIEVLVDIPEEYLFKHRTT